MVYEPYSIFVSFDSSTEHKYLEIFTRILTKLLNVRGTLLESLRLTREGQGPCQFLSWRTLIKGLRIWEVMGWDPPILMGKRY